MAVTVARDDAAAVAALGKIRTIPAGPTLAVWTTPDARDLLARIATLLPPLHVATAGAPLDPPTLVGAFDAMHGAGVGCVVRIEPEGDSAWDLTLLGSCTFDGPAPPPAGALRGPLAVVPSGSRWIVRDADGRALDTEELATAIGDWRTLDRLEHERQRGRLVGTAFVLGGVGLLGLGAVVLSDSHPPSLADFTPDRGRYLNDESFRLAATTARRHYDDAVADEQDERLWDATFFASAAVLAFAVAPLHVADLHARRSDPSRVYSEVELRAAVDAWNHAAGVSVTFR
jgi:hypothetical protein